jgi:hypothetical protein
MEVDLGHHRHYLRADPAEPAAMELHGPPVAAKHHRDLRAALRVSYLIHDNHVAARPGPQAGAPRERRAGQQLDAVAHV